MFRSYFYYILFFNIAACFGTPLCAQVADFEQRLNNANDTTAIKDLLNEGMSLIDVDNIKARRLYETTLAKSRKLRFDLGIGISYSRIAYIEGQAGNQREGVRYNLAALEYFLRINRTRAIIISYNNLGYNYDILGMADSSLYYFLKGTELLRKEGSEPDKLARLFENIATLLANRNDSAKAVGYADSAVHYALLSSDTDHIITSYTGKSNVLSKVKRHAEALQAAKKAREYLGAVTDRVLNAKVNLSLAAAFVALKQPDSSIAAAKKSMEYSAADDINNYLSAGIDLADAYQLKNDLTAQRRVLRDLEDKAAKLGNLYYLFDIYARLARLSRISGDYEAAYDYQVKHGLYKDSFYNEKGRRDLAEIEARYRTAENQKALAEQRLLLARNNLQLEQSNRYVIYTIAAFIIVSLLAMGIFMQMRNKRKNLQSNMVRIQQQKEIDVLNATMEGEEKERLRISRDLHDGVAGILVASKMHLGKIAQHIPALKMEQSYELGIRLLDEAAGEIRKTSHRLMPEILIQYGLEEAVRRHCGTIQNINGLKVQYDCWGEMVRFKPHFELAVYRIVQELLNNVVKHSGASAVIVQMNHQADLLSIAVEDNGKGFCSDEVDQPGIGLRNIKSRVNAMNGRLEIETSPGSGVNAYLEFETSGLKVLNLVS